MSLTDSPEHLDRRDKAAHAMCEALEIEPSATNLEQADVFARALAKYDERNSEYRDLWKEGGTSDSVFHVGHKFARMKRLAENASLLAQGTANYPQFLDNAIDLLNYTVFAIRNKRAGR